MPTNTTNYNLVKPTKATDNADIDVINTNMDTIDSQMKTNANAAAAVSVVANAALPKAGGTMTGDLDIDKAVATLKSSTSYLFLAGKTGIYLSSNAYFDGTNWQRFDTAQASAMIVPSANNGILEFRTAPAGANPITWTINTVWHSGNDGAGSGLDADTLDGIQAAAFALLASPALTGVPTAPTAAAGTNTTQLATTAFVEAARVILAAATALKANTASPILTGVPAAPTAAVDTLTTQLATTQFVVNQAASVAPLMDAVATVGVSRRYARQDHIHPDDTSKANLASPTFTGTVTLPSTTSIGLVSSTEIGYLNGVTSAIQTQINTKAPLASPALTGVPTAPTATAGTNTTRLATTAFVTTGLATHAAIQTAHGATASIIASKILLRDANGRGAVNGIVFPASQVASANANTLDDYEEGSWSPLLGSDGTDSGQTITATGTYVKIGKVVTINFTIWLQVVGTLGGTNAYIKGLPFSATSLYSIYIGRCNGFASNLIALAGVTDSLSSNISLQYTTAASVNPLIVAPKSILAAGTVIDGGCTYNI